MPNTSNKVVEFLSQLHGLTPRARHGGTLDIATGSVINTAKDFPDGRMLKITFTNGEEHFVPNNKVMDFYLARHAHAMSIIEAGGGEITAQHAYRHIADHFIHKTGYGL